MVRTKLKILHVVSGLPTIQTPSFMIFAKRQIDFLRGFGLDIDVLNLSNYGLNSWRKYILGIFELRKRISRNDYDLIHAHYSYCGLISIFQKRVPVIVSFLGSDLLGTPNKQGHLTFRGKIDVKASILLTKFVDHVIVMTHQMSKLIVRKNIVSVIPNGVDFKLFKPMNKISARKHFKLEKQQKIILFACNPKNTVKNYCLALKAFNCLKNKISSQCFLWVFFNHTQEELSIAMNAADVLLLSSFSEGSPNIIKEAMACNLPIVSVNVGDVPQMISSAKNCYLAKYDPFDMANKLALVLESSDRSNGRLLIEHHRWDVVTKQIAEIYNYMTKKNMK